MTLLTPMGEIHILVDGCAVEYHPVRLDASVSCPDIGGRYRIETCFYPDGDEHEIACVLSALNPGATLYIESGERLECVGIYDRDIKLSIGLEGDGGYSAEGVRESLYDYDVEYLSNGMAYGILPFSRTTKYVFGIAWIRPCTDDNDDQTQYAADPTLM